MTDTAQPMTAEEYRQQTLAAFDAQLRQTVRDGEDISGLPAPATAAETAVRSLTTRNYFARNVGPFYSIRKVRQLLGVSRQAIADRVRRGSLLRMVTTDGVHVFPAFQFAGSTVDARLVPVLQVLLGSGESGWTVALWLTAPMTQVEGMTPVEALRTGRTDLVHAVHALAEDSASRWVA